MDLNEVRLGLLLTPITSLWAGTVVSYSTANDAFTLTVTTTSGSLSNVKVGMAVEAGGDLARIKSVNVAGGVLTLAENPISGATGGGFAAGASVAVYHIYPLLPKFERRVRDYVVEYGDDLNQLSNWDIHGATGRKLYWDIQSSPSKVMLYDDWEDSESKVARGAIVGNEVHFEEKNDSGISGSCSIITGWTPVGAAADQYIEVLAEKVYYDYDKDWESLGATSNARSKASQKPVIVVDKQVLVLDVGEQVTVSADGSFATYCGSNVPGTERYPATIPSNGYTWTVGSNLTIISGQGTKTLMVEGAAEGFGYLDLVVTDDNSTSSTRHIPVWCDMEAYEISAYSLEWGVSEGSRIDIEAKVPWAALRHSLACIVDLKTMQAIRLGFIWPMRYQYSWETSTLTCSILPAFSFLRNVHAYPFNLTGIKGDPVTWDDFDKLSAPRAAYRLAHWFSTFLEVTNLEFDVRVDAGASPPAPPSGWAAENRLRYKVNFTEGNLLDQLLMLCRESKYSAYEDPFGGVKVVADLLYGATIQGATYDAMTLDITDEDAYELIDMQLAEHQVADVRLAGWYQDAGGNFHEISVRAPDHPGNYGQPDEEEGLWSTPQDGSDPGYNEILRWAGRRYGIKNFSHLLTFKPWGEIDPRSHKMVDLPQMSSWIERMVVQRIMDRFNAGYIEKQVTGATFGKSVAAVVEPPITVEPPSETEVPPVVPPITTPLDTFLIITHNKIAVSTDFLESDYPEYTDISGSFPDGTVRNCVLHTSGEAWLAVVSTPGDQWEGIWYCSNVLGGSPAWSRILATADARTATGLSGDFHSLCIVGGEVYTTLGGIVGNPGPTHLHYWHGVSSLTLATRDMPTGARHDNTGYQFGFSCHDGAHAFVGLGGGYDAAGQAADAAGSAWYKFTYGVYNTRDVWCAGETKCIASSNITVPDGIFAYSDINTKIIGGASNYRPLVEKNGHYFWTRASDRALMIDTAVQALVNDAGGVDGVFSVSGADGGGYCCVGNYGTIVWLAHSAKALNSRRSIALTKDGGVTWLTRDGLWESVLGAWGGGNLATMTPVVRYASIG